MDEQNTSQSFNEQESNITNDNTNDNTNDVDDITIIPKKYTNLQSLTNDELKKILKNTKQSCKGNKQELIDRIMSLT